MLVFTTNCPESMLLIEWTIFYCIFRKPLDEKKFRSILPRKVQYKTYLETNPQLFYKTGKKRNLDSTYNYHFPSETKIFNSK
ncbi:hypothetical protein BpHYR1_052261 [Brachionus plicatilis]|uniref:Uncharacterized protein n=1 Tax=Brachionus plicatilis TaxID=10195 RepID=A0A3M7TA63_BRAPC|nr:hypothetical protein BpHYR1_052261 [Brachionus plicatilis]